jgi:hypothetical protein
MRIASVDLGGMRIRSKKMIRKELTARILKATQEALARCKEKDARIAAERHRGPAIGDAFLIKPLSKTLCVHWLLVSSHPDDKNLFFAVPSMTLPLLGLWMSNTVKSMSLGACMEFGFRRAI